MNTIEMYDADGNPIPRFCPIDGSALKTYEGILVCEKESHKWKVCSYRGDYVEKRLTQLEPLLRKGCTTSMRLRDWLVLVGVGVAVAVLSVSLYHYAQLPMWACFGIGLVVGVGGFTLYAYRCADYSDELDEAEMNKKEEPTKCEK